MQLFLALTFPVWFPIFLFIWFMVTTIVETYFDDLGLED